MKKNIWLTLLCLSAAVGQNVKGDITQDIQRAEDLAVFSDDPNPFELSELNAMIERHKNDELVGIIKSYRDQVEKKMSSKVQPQPVVKPAAPAQQQNPIVQPQPVQKPVVQPQLEDSNQANLDFVSSIEAKSSQEITSSDIEKLNSIMFSKISDEMGRRITGIVTRYEEYSKKTVVEPAAPAANIDPNKNPLAINLTGTEHAFVDSKIKTRNFSEGDANRLAEILKNRRISPAFRKTIEGLEAEARLFVGQKVDPDKNPLAINLTGDENFFVGNIDKTRNFKEGDANRLAEILKNRRISPAYRKTIEGLEAEARLFEGKLASGSVISNVVLEQSPQTIAEDLKKAQDLLLIIGKQQDESKKSDCKTLLNILTQYKANKDFLKDLGIDDLKGWTDYLRTIMASRHSEGETSGRTSDEPSGSTFDIKESILEQFEEKLGEALKSKNRAQKDAAIKRCITTALITLDGDKDSSNSEHMSNADKNDVLEEMGKILKESRVPATTYIKLTRALGKKYNKMYDFLKIGSNNFSNNFIFDNDDLLDKLLNVIERSKGLKKAGLSRSFSKVVPLVEKCSSEDQQDVVNAVFQHLMGVGVSDANVESYVSRISLNNVANILKSKARAKNHFLKDLEKFAKDPDTLQGIIEVLNDVKSSEITLMKEEDVLGLLKTARSYLKGKGEKSENEDSSGKKRKVTNKKEFVVG